MKKLLSAIYEFFENVGRARAAAYFAQRGMYTEAREIMLYKWSYCVLSYDQAVFKARKFRNDHWY